MQERHFILYKKKRVQERKQRRSQNLFQKVVNLKFAILNLFLTYTPPHPTPPQ